MKREIQDFERIFKGEFFTDSLYTSMYATDASVYRKTPLAIAYPKNDEASSGNAAESHLVAR